MLTSVYFALLLNPFSTAGAFFFCLFIHEPPVKGNIHTLAFRLWLNGVFFLLRPKYFQRNFSGALNRICEKCKLVSIEFEPVYWAGNWVELLWSINICSISCNLQDPKPNRFSVNKFLVKLYVIFIRVLNVWTCIVHRNCIDCGAAYNAVKNNVSCFWRRADIVLNAPTVVGCLQLALRQCLAVVHVIEWK